MLDDLFGDQPGLALQFPGTDRQIFLVDRTGRHQPGEFSRRDPILGDHQHTAGIAIQPVHQKRLVGKFLLQDVDHRDRDPGPRLHGQPRRLVAHQNFLVLVQHLEHEMHLLKKTPHNIARLVNRE